MPHVSYFWDEMEDNVVEEYDGDTGDTTASYTTEPTLYGSVLSQDRSGEKRYFQFDGLGNTTELTDATGTVTDSRRYTACGDEIVTAGTSIFPYTFRGGMGYARSDLYSMYYVRRRFYVAALARWTMIDRLDNPWRKVGYGFESHLSDVWLAPTGPINLPRRPVHIPRKVPGKETVLVRCLCLTPMDNNTYGESWKDVECADLGQVQSCCKKACRNDFPVTYYGGICKGVPTTPEEICDFVENFSTCRSCSKTACLAEVQRVRDAVSKVNIPTLPDYDTWVQCGYSIDYCSRWMWKFESLYEGKRPCVTSVQEVRFRWYLVAGHSAIKIQFCNGAILWVDSGSIGGSDHVGLLYSCGGSVHLSGEKCGPNMMGNVGWDSGKRE